MKQTLTGLFIGLSIFIMPFCLSAAEHDMNNMDHTGMEMSGDMIMLEGDMQDGVKAMAHLRDIREAMGKMGMKETHHFMVMFTDAKSGHPIDTGMMAVKVIDPAGKKSKPHKLMGMEGSFGADVVLQDKGKYSFEVGTKLKDGKKRQFLFHYTVKGTMKN